MIASFYWGADTQISEPVPPDQPVLVPMGGMGFGINGLAHDLSAGEAELVFTPFFAPDPVDQAPPIGTP